jgi:hypothetical protein
MKHRIVAISLLAFACALGALGAPARSYGASRKAISFCVDSSGFATNSLAEFRSLATTTDTARVAMRTQAFLPATSSDSVRLITASDVCLRAAQSIRRSRFQADTGPLSTMVLLRYGSTRFVGLDGAKSGEWMLWTVFDTSFAKVGNFTW